MTRNLQNLNEFFQNMGARPDPKLSRALKRTIFLPLRNASFAEKFSAIIALHGLNRNLQADSAYQRVFKFLVHLPI